MQTNDTKIPVRPDTLLARVRRALRVRGEVLHRAKTTGTVYRVRGVIAQPVDLLDLARELGCIAAHETVQP